MSNYRKGYFDVLYVGRYLTPKQWRRTNRKTARDLRAGHYQTAGWVGGPGECGVECACGTTFDGFDTIAEAAALLDSHIRQRNPIGNPNPPKSLSGHPGRRRAQLGDRTPLRGSFNRYVAVHSPDSHPWQGHSHLLTLMSRAAYLAQSESAR